MGLGDRRLSEEPLYLVVGRIGRPHGVRGEVEVDVWTDFPARFQPGTTLLIGRPDVPDPSPVTVLSSRPHQDRLLVRLSHASDRSAAALLTGMMLLVPTAAAMPLDADTFYHHQLVGLVAVLADGAELGAVVEVMETGATDVLVVRGEGGEVLLPMLATVIQTVDLAAGRITVTPLPGMLE